MNRVQLTKNQQVDFNYEVESDIATGGECKERNKWVQSNMPDARWSIEDARYQNG